MPANLAILRSRAISTKRRRGASIGFGRDHPFRASSPTQPKRSCANPKIHPVIALLANEGATDADGFGVEINEATEAFEPFEFLVFGSQGQGDIANIIVQTG
jgi:hypothetical protein